MVQALAEVGQAVDKFVPFLDATRRQRQEAYTAWWLLLAWEAQPSVPPEYILTILSLAFHGGPRAREEIQRRADAYPGSLYFGCLKLFEEGGGAVGGLFTQIRKLAWSRLPKHLRRVRGEDFRDICRELDLAIVEILRGRLGELAPLEAALLGLDNTFGWLPKAAADALRVERLGPRPASVPIKVRLVDTLPSADEEAAVTESMHRWEARLSPLQREALMQPSQKRVAEAFKVTEAAVSKQVANARAELLRLFNSF